MKKKKKNEIYPCYIININNKTMKKTMKTTMINNKINLTRGCDKIGPLGTDEIKFAVDLIESAPLTESKAKKDSTTGWNEINWKKVESKIKDLQEKIVIATINKDFKEVYRLQWLILQSFEAKALAIRKVITNKGKRTPGVDNIVWKGSKDYGKALQDLTKITKNPEKYIASPVRRVYIPKGNTKEMRPLGIPTMIDRAVQAIYHLGIDPVVEVQSDSNSFGFRKNRSTHDAITAIRSLLDKSTHPRWILEADISKCFDKISHSYLMKHTPICHKGVLEQWLKSGVMEEMNHINTEEGTPQGGIISPVLCNIALNGLEKYIKKANPLRKGISPGVHVIRYADDMIITAKSQDIAIKNKKLLTEFLRERGLELNDKKTLVTHIKTGFDFLGFNIRRMEWDPKLNKNTEQDTVLIIKPSKKGINKLMDSIRKVVIMNKPIRKIISELNPILRGWGEHKRISYHSQDTFIKMDHWIYTKMRKWAIWRKGSIKKTINKFLVQTKTRKWNWGVSLKEKLINLGEISIISLRPLKLDKNPYLKKHIEYFNKRRERIIEAKFRSIIYKIYLQTCPVCGESLHNEEPVELHHIIPQKSKGKYSIENILPLHQICHQQVTLGKHNLEKYRKDPPKIERKNRVRKKDIIQKVSDLESNKNTDGT